MNQGPAVLVIRSVQVPRPADDIVFTVSAELPAGRSARGHCVRAPVPGDGDSPHAGQPRPVPSGVFGADSRTIRSRRPDASEHDNTVMQLSSRTHVRR